MIVARRSEVSGSYDVINDETRGGVALLERSEQPTREKYTVNTEENFEEAKARMQKNLDKLLNYDRYTEEVQNVVEEKQAVKTEVVNVNEDDIRPTSTTMQFGDGDIDQVYNEEKTHKLNLKGKVVVALYTLFLVAIITLIAINTGLLSSLSNVSAEKSSVLSEKVAEYEDLLSEKQRISSDEYVMNYAENELGMIKG